MSRKGQFVKGQSGNPGGLPKGYAEISALARQHAPECIARLFKIAKSSKNERAAAAAAEALLDRGFGKPTQRVEANVNVFDQLGPDESVRLAETLRAIVAGAEAAAGGTDTRH